MKKQRKIVPNKLQYSLAQSEYLHPLLRKTDQAAFLCDRALLHLYQCLPDGQTKRKVLF